MREQPRLPGVRSAVQNLEASLAGRETVCCDA